MYADSVYPLGHYGATGIAFEAGVMGKNLTEWQWLIIHKSPLECFRHLHAVLPKFISTDEENGNDEREFS